MSAARVKTVFPLAVHIGGYNGHGWKVNFSRNTPPHKCCERGPQWDRQGKSFTKPFNLTLAVVFVSSELYLLSQVERLRISEKAVLSP